jgi:hypothetical protein
MTRKQIRSKIRTELFRLTDDHSELGSQSKWPDLELNDLIDHVSKIFCEETGLLETSETVAVTSGVGTITGSVVQIKRIEIDSKPQGWAYESEVDIPITAIG